MKATAERDEGPTQEVVDIYAFWGQSFSEEIDKTPVPTNFRELMVSKGENLKSYLARFNNATIWVNDLDQKFFVKPFQKVLRAKQFSDALALRRSSSMEEIKAQAEKHIEAEEDLADRVKAECQPLVLKEMKQGTSSEVKGEASY
ncbi:hypothetical protein CR513_60393, partial [Mucuna pruriens]